MEHYGDKASLNLKEEETWAFKEAGKGESGVLNPNPSILLLDKQDFIAVR